MDHAVCHQPDDPPKFIIGPHPFPKPQSKRPHAETSSVNPIAVVNKANFFIDYPPVVVIGIR
jgi:hypothetical protein